MSIDKHSHFHLIQPHTYIDQQSQIKLNASLVKQLELNRKMLIFQTKRYENAISLTKSVLLTNHSSLDSKLSNYLQIFQDNCNALKKSNREMKIKYETNINLFEEQNDFLGKEYDKIKEEEFLLSNALQSNEHQIILLEKMIIKEKKEICNFKETYCKYDPNINSLHEKELDNLQLNFENQSKKLNVESIKTGRLSNDYAALMTEMQTYRTHRNFPNKMILSDSHNNNNNDICNYGLTTRSIHKNFIESPYKYDIRDFDLSKYIFKDFETIIEKKKRKPKRKHSNHSSCKSEGGSIKSVPKLNLRQIEFNKQKLPPQLIINIPKKLDKKSLPNIDAYLEQLHKKDLEKTQCKIRDLKENIDLLKKTCKENSEIIARFKKYKRDMSLKIISLSRTYEDQSIIDNSSNKVHNLINENEDNDIKDNAFIINSIYESADEDSLNDLDFLQKNHLNNNTVKENKYLVDFDNGKRAIASISIENMMKLKK